MFEQIKIINVGSLLPGHGWDSKIVHLENFNIDSDVHI